MKSCLHKQPRHGYKNGHRVEHDEVKGIKQTPLIVHREVPVLAASPILESPLRSNSSILSPIRRNSQATDTVTSSIPTSPTSTQGGFAKMSSLVTRPFLRRAKTSFSAIPHSSTEIDSLHAPLLSRSRSTSVGTASAKESGLGEGHHHLGRTLSLGLSSISGHPAPVKPKVAPPVTESARHPGCIDEDVFEEEEAEENDKESERPPLDSQPEHRSHAVHRPSLLIPHLPHSPAPGDHAAVIPIHDCCEACTRTTLLGMRENYIPPFSPSAIRKIKREQEEKEQGARIQEEVAKAVASAAPVSDGPRKIWNGHTWEEEASAINQQKTDASLSLNAPDTADDSDDDDPEQKKSSLGPTFGNEKARTMMVDEVEYVRRMRRASNTSLDEAAQAEASEPEKVKKACFFSGEKMHKSSPKLPVEPISPDQGVWYVRWTMATPVQDTYERHVVLSHRITSKPKLRSPVQSPSMSDQRDYMNAKGPLATPTKSEKIPPASPLQLQHTPVATQSPSIKAEIEEKEDIRRVLEEEANTAKTAGKVSRAGSPRSQSPSSKLMAPDHIPSPDTGKKKWYKLPLPSPLAVPGVS